MFELFLGGLMVAALAWFVNRTLTPAPAPTEDSTVEPVGEELVLPATEPAVMAVVTAVPVTRKPRAPRKSAAPRKPATKRAPRKPKAAKPATAPKEQRRRRNGKEQAGG